MKKPILLFILSMACHALLGQGCPVNIDFEQGDFSGWECFIGKVGVISNTNVMNLYPSPPEANRHEIIAASDKSLDPYGGFPKHCPYGGNYSVKLGNNGVDNEAEALRYTFTVPTGVDTFTLTYFYAVVFEDPQHSAEQQPRFFVTAYDVLTGNVINCASYDYVASSNIPGFKSSPDNSNVWYKAWSPVSIQFASLAGRQVALEFRNADCTQGGHFGYAYVDIGAGCSNILAAAPYCQATNSVILNAPFGYQSYTWYTEDFSTIVGNKQSVTLNPAPGLYTKYWVDLIPYPGFGCRDTVFSHVVAQPVPDTPVAVSDYAICQFSSNKPLQAQANPGNDLLWYTTPTGGDGSTDPIVPQSLTPGLSAYYVSQKVLLGCESFRKEIKVKVKQTPKAAFDINKVIQCLSSNVFEFRNNSTNSQGINPMYRWDYGDGNRDTIYSTTPASHTFKKHGLYTVTMVAENEQVCYTYEQKNVFVVPKPLANFTYPNIICEQQTPVNLLNTSTVPEGLSIINGWWWEINNTQVNTSTPAPFIASAPGSLPIKMVVKTIEGCVSDTNTLALTVRYRPTAAFETNSLLCENEIIQFNDKSAMPGGTPVEFVAKWNWLFDNTSTTTLHHPQRLLTAGEHKVSLMAESNYGCQSLPVENGLTIHTKPHIGITIEDSCIMRTIRFTALDLSHSVSKWYWNFGSGLSESTNTANKYFASAGQYPFTILGKTSNGCKDTLTRPFTIFDNKSFAGRDTLAAMNEPVQLNARGGNHITYQWSPSIGLSDPNIENPIATLERDQLYNLHSVSDKGCVHDSKVLIKRFNGPDLYLPTGFTPNADNNNDQYHVFPVGIRQFQYLAIYNRYGQQVFYTADPKQGWDGTLNGKQQVPGTYVAVAKAIDYRGQEMLKKVSMVLIR